MKKSSKETEAIIEELKKYQRIIELSTDYTKTDPLLNDGIDSAQEIVAMDQTCFIEEIAPKAGINTKDAIDIFRKAKATMNLRQGSMTYRESEREKVVRIRDDFFNDPGDGIYKKQKRPFVLIDPEKNLWYKIRKDAQTYFKANKIVWWPGSSDVTGHLLSSQVSCVNHLFFLRNDKDAALKILQGLNPGFIDVCKDFEDGYIGFEVVSNESYLGEIDAGKKQIRGANCTAVDAMMTGILNNGKKVQILIEWKYTEYYPKNCLADGSSGNTRKARYNPLIQNPLSPIKCTANLDNLYFEPFYQIMRQTLLAWKMVENKKDELNADDWLHFDVIPENNLNLRYQVQTPDLLQTSVEEAWKSQLKEPYKYNVITPQKLLKPVLLEPRNRSMINYLNYRYW